MGYLSNIIISWYRQNIVNCWEFRVKAMGGLLWQSVSVVYVEECSHFMGHTRLAPTHSSMCFLGLHCLGSRLLCKNTVQSKLCVFVLFPGPSNSDDQVLGECTVPGGPCVLITSLVLATQFLRCAARAPSHVCCVSPLGS